MRAVVYTETHWVELGAFAKDVFLKCLPVDENGEFDSINIMTQEIKDNVAELSDADYMCGKDGFAEKVSKIIEEVSIGKKILITDDWTAKPALMDGVTMLNDGLTLTEMIDKLNKDREKSSKVSE